jgi:hyperosmotically inducible periplasmic protein
MRRSLLSSFVIATFLVTGSPAPTARSAGSPQQTAPDNTKNNNRDRSQDEPTADQQKDNTTDREISRKIRSAIMQDKTLSTYAHNIKIVTQDGNVTLKGPVRTRDEKDSIETKAVSVAGQGHVTNQLEIAPKKE